MKILHMKSFFFFFAMSYQLCTTWFVLTAPVLFLRLMIRWPLMTYMITSWTILGQGAFLDRPTDVLLLRRFMHAKQMSLFKSTKFKLYFLSLWWLLLVHNVLRTCIGLSVMVTSISSLSSMSVAWSNISLCNSRGFGTSLRPWNGKNYNITSFIIIS